MRAAASKDHHRHSGKVEISVVGQLRGITEFRKSSQAPSLLVRAHAPSSGRKAGRRPHQPVLPRAPRTPRPPLAYYLDLNYPATRLSASSSALLAKFVPWDISNVMKCCPTILGDGRPWRSEHRRAARRKLCMFPFEEKVCSLLEYYLLQLHEPKQDIRLLSYLLVFA